MFDKSKGILYEVLLDAAERAAPHLISYNGTTPLPDAYETWSPLFRLIAKK